MPLPRVILRPKRAAPFFGRHPWVYPGAIDRLEGDPADGAIVDLVSSAGNFVARGLFNSQSKIRVRLFSWDPDVALDDAFFHKKIDIAVRLRKDTLGLGGPGQASRLIFSEADGLPGLVVDQYDRWLTVQFTSLGLAQRVEAICQALDDIVHPEGIYLRTERGIGALEGLTLSDGPLRGSLPAEPIGIDDQGVTFLVNLAEGQKTGFYLDQRDNRLAVARYAKGQRMLDAFCYTGGFGLHAAKAGATAVLGIDGSETALHLARQNAARNEVANVAFEKADVFAKLDALVAAGERFGVVVLDPPKFARSGHAIEEALRGYRRLQSQGLKLLAADGILVVCCCSGLITRENLGDLLAQLSADQKRGIQILESRGASPDHPVAATCPETNYLKCLICRVE
jgi:23S rRNA (cytosine1962-C5)-methyltransferase